MTVHVVATGGTISSHFTPNSDGGGEWSNLTGRQLLDEQGFTDVVVHDVASGPSSNLSITDMVAIAEHVRGCFDGGATGVVVVHGTDTLDLSAYVTHLLLGGSRVLGPVVFTGSMRVHSDPEPDGPANLRDAVAVASSPIVSGVVACLNGVVHDAPYLNKRTAAAVHAFDSFPFRPIGHVVDGAFVADSVRRSVGPAATGFAHEVALVSCDPGIDTDDVRRAISGRRGVVVEGFGDLNIPQRVWGPVYEAASNGAMVMVASRVFTPTLSNEGLELLGVVGAGGLPAQKAMVLVRAALASTASLAEAYDFAKAHALGHPEEDVLR